MGSFLSIPLLTPRLMFMRPEYTVKYDKEEVDDFAELHEEILEMCETMHRQNTRSKMEEKRLSVYRRNWYEVAQKLVEKYPQWTFEDISNLRFHFELVVDTYNNLLHFCTLNELLDFFQDDSSPQQRRAMFETVDTHKYKAINFEEYLQLMSTMNIMKPVPRPAEIDKDVDEILTLCVDVSEIHPFKLKCYGLF